MTKVLYVKGNPKATEASYSLRLGQDFIGNLKAVHPDAVVSELDLYEDHIPLIDGDVMTGWGEYDLLGPSAFMAAGKPRRVRSLFEGFGYSVADIDASLKRRLMALTLLHRASDPVRHICIEGWQEKAGDLFELQDLIWPV